MSGRGRRLAALAAAFGAALCIGGARQILVGERAMARSDAALERGDARAAVHAAREAAEAMLPGSPYPARGYARLGQIAHDAEARGDDALAAVAWRAAHAAAAETAALGTSNDARLTEANAGILRASRAEHAGEDLGHTERPAPWEALVVACLVLALYAAFERLLSRSSRPPEARP